MVEMARKNLGIGFMAKWAFDSVPSKKGLAFVRLTKHGFFRKWRAARRRNAGNGYIDEFISLLQLAGNKMEP